MSSPALEAFLARLYTDPTLLETFLADPAGTAGHSGLTQAEIMALQDIDRAGLRMAAASYANKRGRRRKSLWQRLKEKLGNSL